MPLPDNTPAGRPGRGPGRPAKITPELVKQAIRHARRGNFRHVVARLIHITPSTFSRWLTLGLSHPEGLYGQLRQGVVEGEARSEARLLRVVALGGFEDPKFACWILERKFPHRWGQFRGETGEIKRRLREAEQALDIEDRARETAGKATP